MLIKMPSAQKAQMQKDLVKTLEDLRSAKDTLSAIAFELEEGKAWQCLGDALEALDDCLDSLSDGIEELS